ncbi:hypothetical protein ABZS66_12320 [Dactylosporangium sp. NPDC005572]|uniref:hypothetical protein n=1 Tax=Dactylosporangium sp. NPDC005572 TaxID=3156889 RepID=UPI0033AA7349
MRAAELAAITSAFAEPALNAVILTGPPGGVGKTQLAQEATASGAVQGRLRAFVGWFSWVSSSSASRPARRLSRMRLLDRAACSFLFQAPVVVGELAYALLERGVLLGQPLGGAFGVLGLQVAELPEEDADSLALVVDFGVGGLEGVLGVERALVP